MSFRPVISAASTGLSSRSTGLSRRDRITWRQPGDRLAVQGDPEGAVVTESTPGPDEDPIQVTPVVVLLQVFPARPSSIPDIRDFVRRCLAESPLTEEGTRQVGETVFRALLDAAGPTGSIQVAFRIFPEHVEVDVLHSDNQIQPLRAAPSGTRSGLATDRAPESSMTTTPVAAGGGPDSSGEGAVGGAPDELAGIVPLGTPGHPDTFADWMSTALRREGLTQEAAARMLGVSVKTVSRWVGGATEPRMRDLRRIQEVFGEIPIS
jgi:DNA-binding XRE family transcriptional regulator